MDSNSHPFEEDGLPVLQLRKWDPSEFPYSPSDFREGFISPTRMSLLLLSYDSEGLLFPLVRGKSLINNDPEVSHEETVSDTPKHKVSSSSEFVELDSRVDNVSGASSSGSADAFMSDVESVAWGLCVDTCDQHEETSFRELLFVSGKHGVIVHAFSHFNESCKAIKPAHANRVGPGLWVEWGPSMELPPNLDLEGESKCHLEASGEFSGSHADFMDGDQSVSSKAWLRTFYTRVDRLTSGNDVYTKFPQRSLFPDNAIISFRILEEDTHFLDLLQRSTASCDKPNDNISASVINKPDTHPDSRVSTTLDDSASNSRGGAVNSLYKCVKVFSNNSYQLVGFALSLTTPMDVSTGNGNDESHIKILIAVARLVSWGLQWVYSINLKENLDRGPFEWVDFSFSHSFLVCLSSCGLISLYGASTGAYVASVSVINKTGPGRSPNSLEQYSDDIPNKRSFKRLFVFPHSSLVGVIDDCGVTYTFRICDHVPEEHFSSEHTLSYQHCLGIGPLNAWEVGGAEIGYQRVLHNAHSQGISRSLRMGKTSYFTDSLLGNENRTSKGTDIRCPRNTYALNINTSSGSTQIMNQKKFIGSDIQSSLLRKVFLLPYGYSEDNIYCFSHFGITCLIKRQSGEKKWSQVVHYNLRLDFIMNDEMNCNLQSRETSSIEAVGCNFNGFLYLVTKKGFSVVLPSISVPTNIFPVEAIGYWLPNCTARSWCSAGNLMEISGIDKHLSPWKVEVLDRVLLYEGHEAAEKLCWENGLSLHISRIRRLQLALNYQEFDEIETSLGMLMGVNLEAEGILRLIFVAVYLMSHEVSNDSAISAASRLLALATSYSTMAIRKYGLLQHKKVNLRSWDVRDNEGALLPLVLTDKEDDEEGNSRRLQEMSHFLVVVRRLQGQINAKFRRPGQSLMGDAGLSADILEDESKGPVVSEDSIILDKSGLPETVPPASEADSASEDNLSLVQVDKHGAKSPADFLGFDGVAMVSKGGGFGKRSLKFENPKDMIERWELDNMDLKTVVKDALHSGRLPLAVLRLHLHRSNSLLPGIEAHDTFNDVRIAGRAIAYDLFLKGEIQLALTTLQKLGEDVETSLKQLVFGSVRRSLRVQVAEEMKKYAYLEPHELKILEMVSLIERVYPCNSFFSTLGTRKMEHKGGSNEDKPNEISLRLLHPLLNNLVIVCGEVDGVVLGPWKTVNEHSFAPEIDDDSNHAAYWTAAVAWSDAWDPTVIDRVLLDQPLLMGVHVLWESQLEYYVCHNEWLEVSKLLDVFPSYALSNGSLSVRLDDVNQASSIEQGQKPTGMTGYNNYTSFLEEPDAVTISVPSVRIFRFPANRACSDWLRMLMEQQLAKKFIFLADYWDGTENIVPLLARSGFMVDPHENLFLDGTTGGTSDSVLVIGDASVNPEAIQALHKVVVHFCSQYNLLNLLDIYLDFHALAMDQNSLSFILDAAGDNEWARCLMLLRIKGKEYDASFSNARAVASRNFTLGKKFTYLETDDIIQAVDDIAEGAGEMAALATLMFAPVPLQECLSSGSVNRNHSSAQCTLENLRPAIQEFPTLRNTLVAACFGHDTVCSNLTLKTKVSGYSDLMDYLNWREGVFFSSARDTSILQMVPCWFPKAVRRLVQLYVQGPIGWQSLADSATEELSILRDIYYVVNSSGHAQISATSWEASVQKHIEEELYASSLEGAGVGLEHYLHRGRALAALNHLLASRVHKMTTDNSQRSQSGTSSTGQVNVHLDLQTILAPLTESEESLLSSVIPLAIEHFNDSVLVASCAFLLELCGLSASVLRVDVAALSRISSFYKSTDNNHLRQLSPKGAGFYQTAVEVDVAESLARALADDYLHRCSANMMQKDNGNNNVCNQPSRALLLVLHHLERASLPAVSNGATCGSWLSTGNGDGAELRSQQKAASQYWQLVTTFCQMHNIPLSTKNLAALARDNDWVGFLSDAQIGKYPIETVIQVASKEFSDPRLKTHILTVLKSMQSRKKVGSTNLNTAESGAEVSLSHENPYIPVELFGIIAMCEKQEKPGEALLLKAKNLCWSILAMIASCFPDVSLLSCLKVWLEITAARETSAIKVNDIASQIARNVGAAVEATNSLSPGARTTAFHYNRKNSKRRRLSESIPQDSSSLAVSDISKVPGVSTITGVNCQEEMDKLGDGDAIYSSDSDSMANALSRMVAVLCEQHLFLPLLQAFEIFLPSCSLLPFIRALQAFSQMRLSEASAHLGAFTISVKEEPLLHTQSNWEREEKIGKSWTSSMAVKAADAMLRTCPSPYEKRCLLRLLSATDFGDGGAIAARYGQLSWKIDMAEPSLRSDECPLLGNETLDDASLLTELEKNGYWEQARSWAKQLEASGESQWKSAANHVTEMQAEAMVAEWKEFLWDVPEERAALWSHCHTLFIRYSFPGLLAGVFFLKHAEAVEKDIPARELHEILLLALQWLSGMITASNPFYPLHLLREIETRVWLLAVESEAQAKGDGEDSLTQHTREQSGSSKDSNLIDRTATIITKIDNHINAMRFKSSENNDRGNSHTHARITQTVDHGFSSTAEGSSKTKRRAKGIGSSKKPLYDPADKSFEPLNVRDESQFMDENFKIDSSLSRWEERVGPAELEWAVLSLLDFGQTAAARQLQNKLSPGNTPPEFLLVDTALKLASLSTPMNRVSVSALDNEVRSVILSYNISIGNGTIDPLEVLESLATILVEGSGNGLCRRIISVVKAANVLGLTFVEAFEKQPIELLQLLSLKAQDSFEEAKLLVKTHTMPAASIAQILAESFLKGLLAAHRGGYIDSQKEEGPAPLLWRFSDFLKWAELCPSDSEIGHALMRLVITGQEIPHECELLLRQGWRPMYGRVIFHALLA
ncbi:uncharacterized protein LOC127248696 isoform X2 [Andrographis paniculata]|uniref:uncharacterized protein LOC127248696 isoform X2 n=1 Tax=Andrographis paniculata TaxID=175694 RepID=UPI0021E7CCD2|nr:uncharacterized protein LOC127248696 isoform X2 [Andrographis paniculata]